ncbi:hypothetical protein KTO58_19725 [Chitinophaga pendula]|uniref:hypothetical protein n=1 Tax=Chitinophaga TaxID=79328 RepID=UPI000BAF31B8|nr:MULTISPECIES: hypothetical protein [Chitinophaga]ASZ11102.1 hypothetical protein CK934_09075 [Chitinophaga sp. MD30]UCJ05900.1 hypothetical protein KTO58_19725 [Chitinophaga pendula]
MKSIGIQLNEHDLTLKLSPIRDSEGIIIRGLTVGDVTRQNIGLLLICHPGELENPFAGIGLSDIALDIDLLAWRHKIREQLQAEGLTVGSLAFANNNELFIDAEYR